MQGKEARAPQLSGEYNIVSPHQEATSDIFILCFNNIVSYYCFKTIISWHRKYQLSTKHKNFTGECFLVEHCVSSWRSYGLNRGIPWNVFLNLYLINIMSF